ncbi:MAG: oxidoreductase [Bacillota bacterium]|nr:MAG: oxidoreductase [Bacillota bacterium]
MKKFKVGVVGCGGIARWKHMEAHKRNPNTEVVAFCDIIEERAVEMRKDFGTADAKVYTDYKELLKDESIDIVLVLTPNNMHCEISVAALNAGKHVLCEKPMAMNYAEAKQMLEARDKSGKVLSIGYQNRYRSDALYLKKLAEKDYFGEIYYAEAHAVRRRGVPTWGVFIDKEKQGGGPLIDIGTHALDLTLFTMNNYEPAYCVGKTFHKLNKQRNTGNGGGDWDVDKFTAEDSAFGFVVMKNGAVIYLKSSWALNISDYDEASTVLCGDKAGADMRKGLRLNTVLEGKQVIVEPDLQGGQILFFESGGTAPEDFELAGFLRAVAGEGELYVTADQAAVVTRILEGIYQSDLTGKPVYFD